MVSLNKIMSFPQELLQTTGALKNHFAFVIHLSSEWLEYFGRVPSEGFTNVAKEAKTVMGFISGIEFFRDISSSINLMDKQVSRLDFFGNVMSQVKKICKFVNFLHTKKIIHSSNIKTVNIQESFFGAVASTINCYKALSTENKSTLNRAVIIETGAFALYDGFSFLDRMGWTREFKTAKMYVATVGVAAGMFRVGYRHFS